LSNAVQGPSFSSAKVDHIPVLWLEPVIGRSTRQLVLVVTGLGGTKETTLPLLGDLALAGFVALSLDAWQHGERGNETQEQLGKRVFGNFRRHFWPILGHTALDILRVIDWAVATLEIKLPVYMVGTSMGGDIAVSAAGVDHRIEKVATVACSPDWLRPGMQGSPGEPDSYAQYFYDHLDPLTHLDAYAHGPAISFVCGEMDTSVPPDGALRFQKALSDVYPASAEKIQVRVLPGKGHFDLVSPDPWWQDSLAWLTGK
jgi:dienelactone hydrolase